MYNRSSRSDSKSKRTTCILAQNQKELGIDVPYIYQSEFVRKDMPENQTQEKVMSFFDENPAVSTVVRTYDDTTRDSAMDSNATLASFFERPVRIREYQWNVGSGFNVVISPWADWFNNTRVKNRLSNFRNFRGNLHLKFVINGNSFYWGSMMVSYCPLPLSAENPFYFTDNGYLPDYMAASQRPKIMIDPSTNQGGELTLPFFWDQDTYDMTAGGMNDLGQVWLTDLFPLRNPSNTNPINLTVFAWVSDIKLSGPTTVNPLGLAPQSEHVEGGPISKPAAIVSKIAGKLEKAPVIAPYAMAANTIASTVGTVARQFGYCRPRVLTNPHLYKNVQTGDMATTDADDTSTSLAFTAKRELTIDPRTTGLSDVDELSFKYLAAKESYLTTVPWELSDEQQTLLFSAPVTPMLCNRQARLFPPTDDATGLSPAGFVCAPFRFWKGTMKMRFQFVGSLYHKGRVLIQWDPAAGDTSIETNTVFSQLVDVSERRDFTITVKWGSPRPALQIGTIPQVTNYSLTPGVAPTNLSFHNGTIKMFVDNRLAYQADSTDPVAFNVFTSWEDLEVFSPNSDNFNFWTPFRVNPPSAAREQPEWEAQSELVDAGSPGISHPHDGDVIDVVGGTPSVKTAAFLHGDPIQSFRQAMKRYCYQNTVVLSQGAPPGAINHSAISQKIFPLFRGIQPGGLHSGGSANLIPTTMYAWIAMCYASFRGSVRYKAYLKNDLRWSHYAKVSRLGANTAYANSSTIVSVNNNTLNSHQTTFDESFAGRSLSIPSTMGNVLEFEVPYYINARFVKCYNRPDQFTQLGWRVEYESFPRPTDVANMGQFVEFYVACGDDMNFFFFRGVPALFFWDP